MQATYAFIGAGNMGRALIGGLLAAGQDRSGIRVADPGAAARSACLTAFGLEAQDDPAAIVDAADVVVLAVKPQILQEVLTPLASRLRDDVLLLSVAAGITTAQLERWAGRPLAVVRAMPNTPALIGAGVAALWANAHATPAQRTLAAGLLDAVGSSAWLTAEAQMDAVTALSGSGPAYFFLFIEHLEHAGIALGLPPALARTLALETAYGASRLARESAHPPATLRTQVTSPGGTTEQALASFAAADFGGIVTRALQAAHARAVELSRQAG